MVNKGFCLMLLCITFNSVYPYIVTPTNKDIQFPVQALNREDTQSFTRIEGNTTKIIHCPDGSYFNDKSMICEFQNDPTDTNTKESSFIKKIENCPILTEDGAAFANPDDCKSFILCGPSGSYIVKCSSNLIFDENSKTCDYPQKNGCCEYQEKNSETFFDPIVSM